MGALIGKRRSERGTMEINSSGWRLALASLLLTAVLVLSQLYDKNFYMTGRLGYSSNGMQCDPHGCKLQIIITNEGYAVDEDLRFELPPGAQTGVYVGSAYQSEKLGSTTVLELGLLHPNNFKNVVLGYPPGSELDSYRLQHLDIYSRTRTAVYTGPQERLYDVELPTWWWALIGVSTSWILLHATIRVFETPRMKLRRLARELVLQRKQFRRKRKAYAKATGLATPGSETRAAGLTANAA
jgi:hypothetical protein